MLTTLLNSCFHLPETNTPCSERAFGTSHKDNSKGTSLQQTWCNWCVSDCMLVPGAWSPTVVRNGSAERNLSTCVIWVILPWRAWHIKQSRNKNDQSIIYIKMRSHCLLRLDDNKSAASCQQMHRHRLAAIWRSQRACCSLLINLQRAGKIHNLQQVCGVSGCLEVQPKYLTRFAILSWRRESYWLNWCVTIDIQTFQVPQNYRETPAFLFAFAYHAWSDFL